MITRGPVGHAGQYLLSVVIVAVCAGVLWRIPAITIGAAAPLLLLAVLLIARAWGTGPALAGSVGASVAFMYYFLPPTGVFIENLTDWVAFVTFTATAVVVGELASRAERRQLEAEEGRHEIEQLYQQLGSAFERASEAEAARRNEQLKAALLDALTHNLRTPLTAIKASVTALLGADATTAMPHLSRESRQDLLQVIDEESDRLNRFIEGLSAADRPDPSQPPSLHRADLDAVVREALTRAEPVLRHHRVHLTIGPNLPALAVDAAAIAEVIYILLDNASKYAPAETAIRIAASVEGSHHIRVTVADEGPGIAADLREQVFEKFFRVAGREPVDPRRAGIGLGLPIARRLVESQAGRIWIESPPSGRGTLVVLTVPSEPVGEESRVVQDLAGAARV
jgi:two-component system sensor histidine kinase KdpD